MLSPYSLRSTQWLRVSSSSKKASSPVRGKYKDQCMRNAWAWNRMIGEENVMYRPKVFTQNMDTRYSGMIIWGCLLHSEPLNEEEVEAEYAQIKDGRFMCRSGFLISLRLWRYNWIEQKDSLMWCATGLETGSLVDTSTSSSTSPAQKRGSVDQNNLTVGTAEGGIASGGKLMPQVPGGPLTYKQWRVPSPGLVRREWVPLNVAMS